jgi:hypothetical protein
MKPVKKSELLSKLETTVEKHLHGAVSIFQNLDAEALLAPSKSGGWSIAQCLEHLNSYGQFYLPAIGKAIRGSKTNAADEVFNSTWLGDYFTKIMDPQTGKKKYKAFKNHVPVTQLDAHAVVAEFIDQQETMLRYLQQARDFNLNDIRIPLSIFKWVTFKLGDAFRFIIAHNERHIQQAKRNLVLQNA